MNNWWIGTRTQYTRHPPVHSWSLNKSLKEAGRQDTGRRSSMWTSSETAWLFHSHGISQSGVLCWRWPEAMDEASQWTRHRSGFSSWRRLLTFAQQLCLKSTSSNQQRARRSQRGACDCQPASGQQEAGCPRKQGPAPLCLNAAGNPHTEAVLVGQQGRTPHHHLTERVLITKNKAFVL